MGGTVSGSHAILMQASEWLSRALAVVLVMIAPGFLGSWLDDWLGTTVLMPAGFALGVIGGTTALVLISRRISNQPVPDASVTEDEQNPRGS
jgi:nitrate reductase gamma subunit